jgi:mono/diheme cytochrome c family protein
LAVVVAGYMQKELLTAAFQTNPYQGSAESVARGEANWTAHCQVCHGPDGEGNGPASAQLSAKPKDLTMVALPPIFPDGIMAFRIANGKNTMPAWNQAFTPEEIWDLVSYIRSKSKKTAKT